MLFGCGFLTPRPILVSPCVLIACPPLLRQSVDVVPLSLSATAGEGRVQICNGGGKHSTPPARHFWVLPQCLYFLFRMNKESFLNCIGLTCLTPVISAANSLPSKPGLAIFEDSLRPSGSLPSCKFLLAGPLWGCNVSLARFYPYFPEETRAFHPQIVFHIFLKL